MSKIAGQWVLITGASSGFGVDYAHIFGGMKANLILTARRTEALNQLSSEISKRYGVKTLVIPADLATREGPGELYQRIKDQGLDVDILINNAGYGIFGEFAGTPWAKMEAMLGVDIFALTQLTSLFLKDMLARNRGHILLVSSIGAYQPAPTYAAYAAAKSYVLNFGIALNYELRHSPVKVSTLSPGVTATEFLQVAGQKPSLYQRLVMMQSRPVAEAAVKALLAGKPSYLPGLFNKLSVLLVRFTPMFLQTRMVDRLMK